MSEQGDSKEEDKAEDTEEDEMRDFDSECSCTDTQESDNRDNRRDCNCHCDHTSADHRPVPCGKLVGGRTCGKIRFYCNACLEVCVPCTVRHDDDGD